MFAAMRLFPRPSGRAWCRLLPMLALSLTAVPVSEARAGLVTFAQFSGVGSSKPFEFTSSPSGPASFQTVNGGAPVVFTFTDSVLPGLPSDLLGPQNAHLFLDLTTTGLAGTAGGQAYQPFLTPGTLKIVRDTPAAEGTGSRQTLLEVTFSGSLIGPHGGSTGTLIGQSNLGTVTFSSDFVGFDATTSRSLSISLNSLSQALALDGSFLRGFQTDATGSFSIDGPLAIVPEPSTIVSAGFAVLALGVLTRRSCKRRRRALG